MSGEPGCQRSTVVPGPQPAGSADRGVVAVAVAGSIGVLVYIAGWALAGAVFPGYDPARDAISETFAISAPTRWWMSVVLVVTGLGLVAFGWAIERGLPGRGLAGPLAAVVAGVGTIGAAAAPCSAGCPGFGTTSTDTWHVIWAGTGYVALLLAPILTAARVRHHLPRFARWSVAIGGLGMVAFVVRNVVDVEPYGGLLQRGFNTLGDAWYLLAAVVILRRARLRDPAA